MCIYCVTMLLVMLCYGYHLGKLQIKKNMCQQYRCDDKAEEDPLCLEEVHGPEHLPWHPACDHIPHAMGADSVGMSGDSSRYLQPHPADQQDREVFKQACGDQDICECFILLQNIGSTTSTKHLIASNEMFT